MKDSEYEIIMAGNYSASQHPITHETMPDKIDARELVKRMCEGESLNPQEMGKLCLWLVEHAK